MKARNCKSLHGHLEAIVMHGTMNNINLLNPSKFGIHGQREIFHVAEIYTSIQFGNKSSIVMLFKGSILKSTDIESNLRPSLFPSNSSSPSLSIPPELFEISLS
ncbi:hypothetical protein CFP56_034144 [Quercus suber]|uniref:Uncharacterized protein n=1 Tax=Quercus suber TaxID=58331 RepID=A0AAW0LU18_QUESU